jgi:ankyrin repeat protein
MAGDSSNSSSSLVQHLTPRLRKLLKAAEDCQLRHVKKYLEAGGPPDTFVETTCQSGDKWVPLVFKAIQFNHFPEHKGSLKLLVDAKANIEYDVNGSTPLMCACQMPDADALSVLLKGGADPCQQIPGTGLTALYAAAASGSVAKCKLLLEADKRTLVLCNALDQSAMFPAVSRGHLPVVTLLHKEFGASLDVHDSTGDTLVHIAAANPASLYVLAYLLRHGIGVNALNKKGGTALFYAAQIGNSAAAQMLLQHGADLTVETNEKDTALVVAIRQNNPAVVEVLLDNGVQLEARYIDNNSALTLAALYGSVEVANLLLQRGADVHAVNSEGLSALHLAVCNNVPELIPLLLQHGADVNARNETGVTPFMLALIRKRDKQIIQLLLDAGADLTTTTVKDETLLHGIDDIALDVLQLLLEQDIMRAVVNDVAPNCECCGKITAIMSCTQPAHWKLLVTAGADVHKTTDTGNTALHVAVKHKHPVPILCLLIKAGVDLSAVNDLGMTAAELAAQCGNHLAAALLLRSELGP